MIITRTFGRFLRGKATPFQIYTAAVLAGLIAFIPGFTQAPALLLLWILALILLNANLLVAAVLIGVFKLLALLLLPLAFHLGRLLLDGPLAPLFAAAVDAPILAWFGLDYYAVTGGQFLGLLIGLGAGFVLQRLLTAFRRKMASLEHDSEAFHKWADKGWVKALVFIFVGGNKGKLTWEELLRPRRTNPIRALGVVFALLLIAVVYMLGLLLRDEIVTVFARDALERVHGATVDIETVQFRPAQGRISVHHLAMADPDDLATNFFAASEITAELGASGLLRKRLEIDRLIFLGAAHGTPRERPGIRIAPTPRERPALDLPDLTDLDDILANARLWRDRLAQAQRWLEFLTSGETEPTDPDWRERVTQRARLLGHAHVRAPHLIRSVPTLVIREVRADSITVPWLGEETLALKGAHLSTHPALLEEALSLEFLSSAETLRTAFSLPAGESTGRLAFHYRDLPVDRLAAQLRIGGAQPATGGTATLSAEGTFDPLHLNLPLKVDVRNTQLTLPGIGDRQVSRLELPLTLVGTLQQPAIQLPADDLRRALTNAGQRELIDQLGGRLGLEPGEERIQDRARDALGGLLRRDRREAPPTENNGD
ncbi:MAG: hypothetical protein EA425_06900 [Puniceicoccaceae bacterium]|nr:MAG: hypothetical protein EA425_06900 [Puniceicoccaceae bacterium]